MRNWENFHRITKNKPPRRNIVYFISKYGNSIAGDAIDLGCGSGSDTVFLIKNNWIFCWNDSEVNVETKSI